MRRHVNADRILERRQRVATLHLQGRTQRDIAREVGVDQATISRDMEAVREDWRQAAVADYDAARREELAKIGLLESQAWWAWERSKADHERLVTETKTGGKDGGQTRELTQVDGRLPQNTYLQTVGWCIEQRCKILGLQAPRRAELAVQHTHVDARLLIADPVAANLACDLFERLATGPNQPGGAGVVRDTRLLADRPPPQPPQPEVG